ncbi:DHBP synthase RibB-like alpha/beta domain-containing protein [Perilla frutescens var. frutescens]|nr:DHBP synthase RibB-like alpha/beta domain-containing protein [Perilla frutescens var. frutescens]
MAVEMGRLGGAAAAPLSFRRSPNPSPCRIYSLSTSSISRRFVTLAVVKRSPKRLKYSTPRFTKEDGLLYVEVDPFGSDSWKLDPIVELLKEGAVGVIPTDTVYAIVCDLRNSSAIERLRRIKDIEPSKPLSILCCSFKDIDTYTTGFPRGNGQGLANTFRAVKHCLPGPYTFILTASKALPKECIRYGTTSSKYTSRKNVGVRIPDDAVCKAILEKMDAPLISTSVRSPKEDEWILDPVIIADVYGPEGLDFVVAAGTRLAEPSTVVDMTGNSPRIIRQGKGPKQPWMVAEDEDSPVNEDNPTPVKRKCLGHIRLQKTRPLNFAGSVRVDRLKTSFGMAGLA